MAATRRPSGVSRPGGARASALPRFLTAVVAGSLAAFGFGCARGQGRSLWAWAALRQLAPSAPRVDCGSLLRGPSPPRRRCERSPWALRAVKPTDADVERTVIHPLYRSTVAEAEAAASAAGSAGALRVLVLGEANICRSPIATALLQEELAAAGIADKVVCSSRAVQDFAVGEPIPPHVIDECSVQGLTVPTDHIARVWRPEWDVVDHDLLVAVDRYVAADAMKEVAVYDAIQKKVEYCSKIRGLYEFADDNEEIDDPLYGNIGGEAELKAVRQAIAALRRSARGLAGSLAAALLEEGRVAVATDSESAEGASVEELRHRLESMLEGMGLFEWDAPPMLRKRQSESVVELAGDGLLSLEGVL